MNADRVQELHRSLMALKPWLAEHPSTAMAFSADWLFLQDSEAKLILLMNGDKPADSLPGDIEYGLILYLIQTDLPADIVDVLEALGMPATKITSAEYSQWRTTVEGPGVVASDGTLVSTVTFATFDPEWAVACIYYLMSRYADDLPSWLQWVATAPFVTTPATLAIDDVDTLKIALISDWGTGPWSDGASPFCPSQLVQRSASGLQPDIVIHLGDVYYYGSSAQEQANLIDVWVPGAKASFTLNSNHEMYDGATGYYSALSNWAFSA